MGDYNEQGFTQSMVPEAGKTKMEELHLMRALLLCQNPAEGTGKRGKNSLLQKKIHSHDNEPAPEITLIYS
jgi:hypothetical protein